MKTVRTFIAIELLDQARSALIEVQNRLKALVPPKSVRWTAPQNIHLTLHFLGDINAADVEKAAEVVKVAASNYQPFTLTLTGLGCFPNTQRPRILWVGVRGETRLLAALYQELGERLKVINFTPETRPYSAHLTIGRVNKIPPRHLPQLGAVLEQEKQAIGELAQLAVTEIKLIKSDLQPAGPVYTPLARGILGAS